MDKLWIVLLFLCVFFIMNNAAKRTIFKIMAKNSEEIEEKISVEDKEDPAVFWMAEGKRREPENAKFVLPEEDFFENEKTEFFETFEEELKDLSDEESEKILIESGLFLEGGDSLK